MQNIMTSWLVSLTLMTTLSAQGLMVNQFDHIGQSITDLEITNTNEVWGIGQNKILYSTNLGDTWKEIDFFNVENNLTFIAPFNENHFLVAGNLVYLTSDQGKNWTQIEELKNINQKFAYNETVILNSKDSGLFISNDQGQSWTNISPSNFDPTINPVDFISSTQGFAADTAGNLLHTSNSGTTWTQLNSTAFNAPIELIAFKNDLEGIIKIEDNIYETIDGGSSWTLFWENSNQVFQLYAKPSGYYAQTGSRISSINNGGATSYLTNDDTNDVNISLHYEEHDNMHFVSGIGMILRKEILEPLENWIDLTPGPNNGFDKIAILGDQIFLTGNKKFQLSSDYGSNFTQNKVAGFSVDGEILIDTNGDLYTADGQVRRSTDQGLNWEYISQGRYIHKFEDGRLYMANGVQLLMTNDFGENIETIFEIPSGSINDVYFFNHDFGWLTTSSNKAYRTIDGGSNWEEIAINFRSPDKVQFIDEMLGYGVDQNGDYFFKTIDGGLTWDQFDLEDYGVNIVISDLVFIDQDRGFISGGIQGSSGGVVYATDDGGETWSAFQKGFDQFQALVYDQDKQTLWTTGKGGQLFNYKMCDDLTPSITLSENRLNCTTQSETYIWFLNGAYFTETTESFIDLIQEGNYSVHVLGPDNCTSQQSEAISYISSSTVGLKTQQQVKVYPNPSHGNFTVDIETFTNPQLTLYRLDGSQVFHEIHFDNEQANIYDLPTGNYILTVQDTNSISIIKIIAL